MVWLFLKNAGIYLSKIEMMLISDILAEVITEYLERRVFVCRGGAINSSSEYEFKWQACVSRQGSLNELQIFLLFSVFDVKPHNSFHSIREQMYFTNVIIELILIYILMVQENWEKEDDICQYAWLGMYQLSQ